MSTIDYRDPSLLATLSSNGLMSSADKAKLTGLGSVLDGYSTTTSLQAETNRALAAESQIRTLVDGYALKTALLAETNRATAVENQLKTAADGYTTKTYVDGYAASIKASITAETNRAMAAESQIRTALDGYSGGGGGSTDGYATVAYVDGYAASIKATVTAETNRALAEENIIKAALDGYTMTYSGEPFSVMQVTGGLGMSVFEGVATLTAESVETLAQNETNRAIAEENIIKAALDGYSGGGASGVVQTIRFAIGTGATQDSVTNIPAAAVVQSCVLRLDTPYSLGTTISVGRSGSIALVQATTDNDPTTAGLYQVPQDTLWGVLGPVRITIGGSPGVGAGYCSVNYVVANA